MVSSKLTIHIQAVPYKKVNYKNLAFPPLNCFLTTDFKKSVNKLQLLYMLQGVLIYEGRHYRIK